MPDEPTRLSVRRGRTPISREEALLRYLALGESRSFNKLVAQLDEAELHINKHTIEEWSKADRWVERARDFDEHRKTAISADLAEHATDMDLRQIEMARTMQDIVNLQLKQLAVSLNQDSVGLSVNEIATLARLSTQMERVASGAATGSAPQLYNIIIQPVLVLFQQLVQQLPDNQREVITRQFADGVNNIRDSIIQTTVVEKP